MCLASTLPCQDYIDDVLPLLNGAKFFTKLDTISAYWNVKLSD